MTLFPQVTSSQSRSLNTEQVLTKSGTASRASMASLLLHCMPLHPGLAPAPEADLKRSHSAARNPFDVKGFKLQAYEVSVAQD